MIDYLGAFSPPANTILKFGVFTTDRVVQNKLKWLFLALLRPLASSAVLLRRRQSSGDRGAALMPAITQPVIRDGRRNS